MNTTTCTFIALLVFAGCSCGPSAPHVADPYAHAIAQSYGTSLMRIFVDLNDDGVKELFVGSTSDSGSGGQGRHMYHKTSRDYIYLGYVFGKVIKLERTKHKGFHDLKVLQRLGGGIDLDTEGTLMSFRWNGAEYVMVSKLTGTYSQFGLIDPTTKDWVDFTGWLSLRDEYCPDYLGGNRTWHRHPK